MVTPKKLSATLHHIALESPDPQALADFYAHAMALDLAVKDGVVIGEAEGRMVKFLPGTAKKLALAAYALADGDELSRLTERLDAAAWPFDPVATDEFDDAIELSDPDGNVFVFGTLRDRATARPSAIQARLQHVVMASTDATRLAQFMEEVVGFTRSDNVVDSEGGIRTVFLRSSEEHHSFAVFQADECRFDHHCYETSDWNAIRDWSDHLATLKIPLQWGPGRHGPGNNLFIFMHDPDGNWVELSAELETVDADRPLGTWPHESLTLNRWGTAFLRS